MAKLGKDANVISHWHHPIENFQTSTLEFYAAVEVALQPRQIPDYTVSVAIRGCYARIKAMENSNGRKGSVLVLALVVVIVLAAAGGIWWYEAHKSSQSTPSPSASQSGPQINSLSPSSTVGYSQGGNGSSSQNNATAPATQQPTPTQSVGWQSFSDPRGKYSIMYPSPEFNLLQSSADNPGGETDGGLEIYTGTSTDFMDISYSFGTHGPRGDLAQLLPIVQNEAAQSGGSYSTSTVTVGGFEGTEISITAPSSNGVMNVYVFGTGEDVYTITVHPTTPSNEAIARGIISSFKSSL